MNSAWLWLGAGALAALGAMYVYAQRRRRPATGFRALLRNPDAVVHMEQQWEAHQQRRTTVRAWPDDKIATAVRSFVLKRTAEGDAQVLRAQLREHPQRAALFALQVLQDPALGEVLREPQPPVDGRSDLLESPAQRICSLLEEDPTESALPALLPLLQDAHDGTRKMAALVCGAIGTAAAAEGVVAALRDQDDFVRSYAVLGLKRAQEGGRLAAGLREAVFDALIEAVVTHADDKAAALAARLAPERAQAALAARGCFDGEAPPRTLAAALDAMVAARQLLPRHELLALWRRCSREDGYGPARARAAIVHMLGAHGHPDDGALLDELMQGEERVAEAAAAAIMDRLGMRGLDQRIHRKRYEVMQPLTAAERRHEAMTALDYEVCNGGLDQYFFNSAGNDWDAALEGLATHDPGRAELLRAAMARFGDAPSRDRATRTRQLAGLHEHDDKPFADLDQRWYASKLPIEVVLARHATAHAAELGAG